MADPRFFKAKGPFPLSRLAEIAGATLGPGADPNAEFTDVAALEDAGTAQVSFLDNRRYLAAFAKSQAGACVVHPDIADRAPPGMALLLSEAPYKAYALIARAFYPAEIAEPGIHRMANVDPTAQLAEGVSVEASAVIGPRAEIGPRSRIGANAVIGAGVVIGSDCIVGVNASLACCIVGARVMIYPGVRIGQDGFGFASDRAGHTKVPQLGRVLIGDDVEIGANTCIDRGSASDTVIGDGCMIDNLVQIGHNVRLGRGCVLVSQVGISGSTHLEDYVMVGGQGGLAGHLRVGAGAKVAAQSGVHRNIPAGEAVGGSPAVPVEEWRRQVAVLRRLAKRKASE
ncbi:MAG: UDP-3-O-(3-hydroxymyristoyl)glucosamine N-acyltransferase [Rhodospirillales bacterium]|nr:UDP-3-O-(3-hydroxymyristoyl)glucosamine N-acyltransferase [Rhodospirillales bacterium]